MPLEEEEAEEDEERERERDRERASERDKIEVDYKKREVLEVRRKWDCQKSLNSSKL